MTEQQFGLGLIGPDPKDERDLQLSAFISEATIPQVFSYRSKTTPLKNQSSFGGCAAFAGVGAKEYQENTEGELEDLSEQDLYGKAKTRDGFGGEGTTLRAIVESLYKEGVCEESYFPYEAKYPPTNSPKPGAVENAAKYKITNYANINNTIDAVTQAVYTTGPCLGGFWVYNGIYNVKSDGIIPMPAANEQSIGGHAMVIIGYDLNRQMLELRNSWGPTYGDHGHLWMPFTVFIRSIMDCWTTVDVVKLLTQWSDWDINDPASVNAANLVYNKGVFQGKTPTTFDLYSTMTKRQVFLVAQRLKIVLDSSLEKDYSVAIRSWVRDSIPGLRWNGDSTGNMLWDKSLTRYEMCMLIARYITDNNL